MKATETTLVRRKKPKLKLSDAPAVSSIKDLIELGKTFKVYRNIDTIMLWRDRNGVFKRNYFSPSYLLLAGNAFEK
jgi:hypothetical protein